MRGRWIALGLLVLLGACAGTDRPTPRASRAPASAEPAWAAAMLMLPGEVAPRRLVEALPELAATPRPLGVVVYAHGCRGFDAEAIETMRMLAGNGFAVVAPDHHAREDAAGFCRPPPSRPLGLVRPTRRDPGLGRVVPADLPEALDPAYVRSRIEEVEHALTRLRAQPWADPRRLYLVGETLGRGTAGLWPTNGLAAAAVLGQDCRRASDLAGHEMPLVVPVLPLLDRGGPGRAEALRARHCGEYAGLPEGGLVIGVGLRGQAMPPEARRTLLDLLHGVTRS
jgi:dienelactone hydrolase